MMKPSEGFEHRINTLGRKRQPGEGKPSNPPPVKRVVHATRYGVEERRIKR